MAAALAPIHAGGSGFASGLGETAKASSGSALFANRDLLGFPALHNWVEERRNAPSNLGEISVQRA
jgi:hypothetical protein